MKSYTVNFYELVNCGGIWQSNGTTTITGYEEEYTTENKEDAVSEFEFRKNEITRSNKLGVTLSTWENDEEIEQTNFSSENLK